MAYRFATRGRSAARALRAPATPPLVLLLVLGGLGCGPDRPAPVDGGDDGPLPACQNRIRDLTETDVDCGGPCSPCDDGGRCLANSDCVSGLCQGDHCATDFFVDAPRAFEAGLFPTDVVIADATGDGKPDVLVALRNEFTFNMQVEHLAILETGLDGTLKAPRAFVSPGYPETMAAGDFNGDKLADVALPDGNGEQVAILLADGGAGFRKATTFPGISAATAAATGDFDGDGKLDLVLGGFGAVLLRGDGTGRFAAPIAFSPGVRVAGLAVADWNGDKRDDVVISGAFGGAALLLGQALPGFRPGPPIALTSVGDVTPCEFDKDGNADLCLIDIDSGSVAVLLGRGDGSFARGPSATTPVLDHALVAAADFNGDGVVDLVTADGTGRALFFAGSGGGGGGKLEDGVEWDTGIAPAGIAAADLDGDGRSDLVAANPETDDVTLVRGRGDNARATVELVPGLDNALTVLAADLDGDGRDDLVTGSRGNGLEVRLSLEGGTFGPPRAQWIGGLPDSMVPADLDGDGRPEIVAAVRTSRQVTVLRNDGKGTLTASDPVDTSGDPSGLAVGDLDKDGRLDVAVVDHKSGEVRVLLQRGATGFQHLEPIKVGPGAFAPAICDLDGDGDNDLVVVISGSARKSLAVLLQTGEMAFGAPTTYPFGSFDADANASAVLCRDLDGRGRPEVVAIDAGSAREKNVSVLSVQEGGALKTIENNFASASLASLAAGALHPGGRPHLLVAGPRGVGLLLGDGSARFQPVITYRVGGASFGAAFGDFDGDRHTDVAAVIEGLPTQVGILRNRRPKTTP